MNKEELIGKLQMVYVGDRNALNELVGYYDGLKQGIEQIQHQLEQERQKQLEKDYKKDLQNRIDKAIEYIEKNFDEYSEFVFGIKLKNEILNILKESGE